MSSVSLQSYAFQLRKKLLQGASLESLLDCHAQHQQFLGEIAPRIELSKLSLADRFAWKFLREINILNPEFANKINQTEKKSKKKISSYSGEGLYQNLPDIIKNVQEIWFSDMKSLPNTVWLKQFTIRKLAHCSFKKDEIAFSLVFDFPDVPAEILSYLAYHELLHRELGVKRLNGRQYAHTREFKSQEQLFPNWRQLDKQINEYLYHTI